LRNRKTKTPQEVEAEKRKLERLHIAIGRFIFGFSQLEFMIRHALGCALYLNDDRFDVITSSITSPLYATLLKHSLYDTWVAPRMSRRKLTVF
jgi:hypothetical protein